MDKLINHIVIVGGGSAGWLSAAILAKKYHSSNSDIKVSLIESQEFASIGVGEGTWPTMRETLFNIGIDEKDLITLCDASYKQGSQFNRWRTGQDGDSYLHPFTAPRAFEQFDLAPYWLENSSQSYAQSVCFQTSLCQQYMAPKLPLDKNYQGFANYGYHLDAGKFGQLLQKHCKEKLGVEHIQDTVENVQLDSDDFISHLTLKSGQQIQGDFFVDCSGFNALLLSKTYGIKVKDFSDVLLVNKALATQQPYEDENQPIQSATLSTAQSAGWIWDIGLSSRRGVGYVYSDKYCDKTQALSTLANYLNKPEDALKVKEISFNSGHREKFWHKNCVGIGLAAGFLEPLEASALMLIELSAHFVSDHLPRQQALLPLVEQQFNQSFSQRWQSIVDFLRLHYQLSTREEPFWQDSRAANSTPLQLQQRLRLWQERPPLKSDFLFAEEMFPAASYHYILYGMNFKTDTTASAHRVAMPERAQQLFQLVQQQSQQVGSRAQTNRQVINQIKSAYQTV